LFSEDLTGGAENFVARIFLGGFKGWLFSRSAMATPKGSCQSLASMVWSSNVFLASRGSPPPGLELVSCGKNRKTPLPTPIKVISGSHGTVGALSSLSATVRRRLRHWIQSTGYVCSLHLLIIGQ